MLFQAIQRTIFSSGSTRFSTMAKIAHRPTPAKLTLPTFTSIPPTPVVKTELTITRFSVHQIYLCVYQRFRPSEAIVPNSRIITPPITGRGIELRKALNLPKKAMQMANTAAQVMMTGLLFFVSITAPVTSP